MTFSMTFFVVDMNEWVTFLIYYDNLCKVFINNITI